MIRRAIAPGSYDPITMGHLDVITRAALLFDEVLVAVLHNPAKSGAFAVDQRIAFIEQATAELLQVKVEAFANQLLVEVARQVGASVIVKGLRDVNDYAYELPMARMNLHLSGIETLFLPGNPAHAHVSSSLVKEVARFGGDLAGMVPAPVAAALALRS